MPLVTDYLAYCAATLTLLGTPSALAGNLDTFYLSNGAVLQGGAITADTRGGGSIGYNPAGLAKLPRLRFDVSASAYALRLGGEPDVTVQGKGSELTQLSNVDFQIVPTALTLTHQLGALAVGFGVLVPAQTTTLLTTHAISPASSEQLFDVDIAVDLYEKYHDYFASPAWAFQLDSRVDWGLTATPSVQATPSANGEQDPMPGSGAASTEVAHDRHRLTWTFPRFRWWQYVLSVAATGYFSYSVFAQPRQIDWSWRTHLPGDVAVRNALGANGHAGRRKADNASNRLWHIVEFFPFADGIVTPLLADDLNVDVAWQLTLLNWEGIAVMGAVNRLTHDFVRRDRPALTGCVSAGSEYSHYCTSSSAAPRQSFISGHAASVFFGAGATCAHHTALAMYGHPVADAGVCALGLGAATVAGALRIVADAHWLSDVLFGAMAGFGSGFGFAYGLHYATSLRQLEQAGLMLLPIASDTTMELHLLGKL